MWRKGLISFTIMGCTLLLGCGHKNTQSNFQTESTIGTTEYITTESEVLSKVETTENVTTTEEIITTEVPTTTPPEPEPITIPTNPPTEPVTESPTEPPVTIAGDNSINSPNIQSLKSGNIYIECNGNNGVTYDLVCSQSKLNSLNIYLPTWADNSNLTLWETMEGDISIDGIFVANGSNVSLSTGEHQLSYNGKNTTLKIMHSANVPSIFIDAALPLKSLHSNKNQSTDGSISFIDTNGNITTTTLEKMNGRGNSSWEAGSLFGKYPYNIKLDKATDIFGIATNKKWCLIAQVFDESLIRDYSMYELAKLEGMEYTPSGENVDVYYNNEYIGTYFLSQKIDVGKKSLINIYDLEKENKQANPDVDIDNAKRYSEGGDLWGCEPGSYKYCDIKSPSDISSGYLLEFELNERYGAEKCGFVTRRGQPVVIKYPEVCSKEEVEFIREYVQNLEDAIYSESGMLPSGQSYSEIIDVDSFAKVYLINEIAMNVDATATSFFLYLDKDSPLKAGPIWDFDWALGAYSSRNGVNLAEGKEWYVRYKNIYGEIKKDFIATLCSRPEFWQRVGEIWNGSMKNNLQTIINNIDSYGAFYHATADMNFTKYKILPLEPQWGSAETGKTYDANISYLKNYLINRINFMNF